MDALWNETMRLKSVAPPVRTVAADTVIGGRMLRVGNRFTIPYRQLHLEPRIFGEDSLASRTSRFQKKTIAGPRRATGACPGGQTRQTW